MPAPAHIRVQYSGSFGDAATRSEIWSIGVAIAPGQASPEKPFITKENLVAASQRLHDAFGLLLPVLTSHVVHRMTKVSFVDATGHVALDQNGAYVQAVREGAVQGAGAAGVPWNVAAVIGLRSAADGPTGRGRFYLPAPVFGGVGVDGRVSTTQRDAWLTRATNFLNELNVVAGLNSFGRVSVASGGSITRGINPALRPVIRAEAGRVLDTQRRRRGDLAEDYARVSLA